MIGKEKENQVYYNGRSGAGKMGNIEANSEFPILTPRSNTTPQEPVAEEPQINGLLYENGPLKEEVQMLRRELENWK